VFSRFFINRPIFAAVLSILVTLAGGIAVWTLPITQYPEITPPTVEVSASYPGANADVVMNTVAAPIEQQVNGVENMMYMSSQCTNDGTYTLTVTFKVGTDLNIAQVLVQNRVTLATPVLPDLVKRLGVSVKKKSPTVLMIINLYSPDNSRSSLYLSNYATIQLRDELARLPGVGDITYLGQRDYSMRIWLDPDKLRGRRLSSNDVVEQIQQQNAQVAAGQIGQPPVPRGQVFQYTMTTLGRLANPEQFADIILKTDSQGRPVRLRDVASIELGAQNYNQTCTMDGKPSVALSVYQLPGSNAIDVANSVRAKMEELKKNFHSGVDYAIVYDTTPVIQESINEVFKTLRDAVLLVAFVVLLFLQNWRSAIIPLVAVPVAIIGTFAAMAALGFSLNNLTLFGLVLAIGIVVDDAIVVVEAVEHHIEEGLAPRAATLQAMSEVSGPVIAIGLVLSAVFVPCAFIAGIIGQFFRQFALTIAISTLISAFNSLTLSPALCALLLKPSGHGPRHEVLPRHGIAVILALAAAWLLASPLGDWLTPYAGDVPGNLGEQRYLWVIRLLLATAGYAFGLIFSGPINFLLSWSFHGFNQGFAAATAGYTRAIAGLLRVSLLMLVVYAGLLALTWWGFTTTPTGFIPAQDKGYLLVNAQLPDAASVGRTEWLMKRIERLTLRQPGVRHTVASAGQSLLLGANSPNYGSMYVMLDDFHRRAHEGLSADVIASRLQETLQEAVPQAQINIFGAPPVEGLGTAGGFKIIIEDRGDNGPDLLQKTAGDVKTQAEQQGGLEGLFTSFRANTPWIYLDIDRTHAKMMGVSLNEVFNTLQHEVGSYYVNDFNRFGRTWQVIVQGGAVFRGGVDDLKHLQVRSDSGKMVPLGTLATVRSINGPVMLVRYNMYPAAPVNGRPDSSVSSGQAIQLMQRAVQEKLPQSMRYEWTELALLQLQTGNTAMLVFLLAVVLVFLVLAAQYESWSLPLAVILVVPMCLLCSITGVVIAKMDINIFTQVGFIVLVGLACKNAILIVEFAKSRREAGVPRREATLAACRLRLRPIMMTSFAFILGVVPLVLASGAGAEMRRTLGTAVFSGMLGVTLFGIFLTPIFYYVIQWVKDRRGERTPPPTEEGPPAPSGNGETTAPLTAIKAARVG
jgi:multidrug efflux pump